MYLIKTYVKLFSFNTSVSNFVVKRLSLLQNTRKIYMMNFHAFRMIYIDFDKIII